MNSHFILLVPRLSLAKGIKVICFINISSFERVSYFLMGSLFICTWFCSRINLLWFVLHFSSVLGFSKLPFNVWFPNFL
jgi:hypothetical protein